MIATLIVVLALAGSAMFRGNAEHSGSYDAPGVPALHGIKWKFRTGGRVYASPAVADGMVFVGSTDNNLYAIDVATGEQKWKFATKGRVVSSPAVQAGVVYFESYDSNFYAVDAASGQVKWTFATKGEKRFAAKHMHGMLPENDTMADPFDFFPDHYKEHLVAGYSKTTASGGLLVYMPDYNKIAKPLSPH